MAPDGSTLRSNILGGVVVMDARAAVQAPRNGTPGQLLCPFDLKIWAVDRMLNFERPIDPARFELSPDGVDVDVHVHLTDVAGRSVRVRIDGRAVASGR